MFFKFENSPIGAGMGSGFVGQIADSFYNGRNWKRRNFPLYCNNLLHFILPAVVTLIIAGFMRKKGCIKDGDLKLNL